MTKIQTRYGFIDETKLCAHYSDNGYNGRGGCRYGRCDTQGISFGQQAGSSSAGHKLPCFYYISIADARRQEKSTRAANSSDIGGLIKDLRYLQKVGRKPK